MIIPQRKAFPNCKQYSLFSRSFFVSFVVVSLSLGPSLPPYLSGLQTADLNGVHSILLEACLIELSAVLKRLLLLGLLGAVGDHCERKQSGGVSFSKALRTKSYTFYKYLRGISHFTQSLYNPPL